PVYGNHVCGLGCTRSLSQFPDFAQGRAQRLLDYYTRKVRLQQPYANLGDELNRNHRDAHVQFLAGKHLVERAIGTGEAILSAEEFCALESHIAYRREFDCARTLRRITRPWHGMPDFGVL